MIKIPDDPFYQPTRPTRVPDAPASFSMLAQTAPVAFSDSPKARINGEDTPRTFFCRATGGTDITVSAGAINNVYVPDATISAPSNGDKIYIDATVTAGTSTVTAASIASGASVPANTSTKAYTLLASVVVTSGVADAVPVAWNYSQLQRCGGSNYLWGGFGA